MQNRKVTFDFGAWLQTLLVTSMLPYTMQAFPAILIALEPDRWLLQVQPDGYIRFDHGVEDIRDTRSLSNLDFSKCFVEVDVVEMRLSGKEQRHTLVVLPFQPQKYGQTCEHHPMHLDFRPLAAPMGHLNQLGVHLRNSEDVGVPCYTGLVGLFLYFHKGPALLSSSMRLQGGRHVMLESNAQLELFPENKPAHFRICLPEMWSLDRTWEVGLFQLLLSHTWCNVLTRQVGMHLHYSSVNPDVHVFPWAGTYVTVQDVVEGWLQLMEANVSKEDDVRGLTVVLNERGFCKWWRSPDAMATINPPRSRSRAVTPWPNTAKPACGAPSPSTPSRTCTCTATSASRCTWARKWPRSS